MFAPPPVIATEVFAGLPQEMRRAGQPSADGQPGAAALAARRPARAACFAQTCRSAASFASRTTAGSPLIADYDGEANGLEIHKDGRPFIADFKHGIVRLDPRDRHGRAVCVRHRLERFKATNDLLFASNGDPYFTDQGLSGLHDPTGRVFRVRADGAGPARVRAHVRFTRGTAGSGRFGRR